jgi:hypothetical protein
MAPGKSPHDLVVWASRLVFNGMWRSSNVHELEDHEKARVVREKDLGDKAALVEV